jgi:hypothetical protein
MTTQQELLRHASRCRRLAENCRDPAVSVKLLELAVYYSDLAGLPAIHSDVPQAILDGRAASTAISRKTAARKSGGVVA